VVYVATIAKLLPADRELAMRVVPAIFPGVGRR
jgi:hypothetical protein